MNDVVGRKCRVGGEEMKRRRRRRVEGKEEEDQLRVRKEEGETDERGVRKEVCKERNWPANCMRK